MNAAFIALLFALFTQILTIFADDGTYYRLPNGKITLKSYNLKIIPNLKDEFTFDGEVHVVLKVLEEMKCITMNSKNLHIKKIEYEEDGCTSCNIAHKLLEDKEMLELCFPNILQRHTTLKIKISYTGKMRDDFKGLYRVQYEENGSKKWLAAALLEPTYARMVFPCFDEPQYNAKFTLSIARYPDQISTSVTDVRSTSNRDPEVDNRVWDYFEDTVPCAPYSMSFTVHSFISSTKRINQLGVYSRKHTDKDVEFITSNYHNWYKTLSEYIGAYGYFDSYIDIVALPDGDEFSQKGTMMIYKEKDVLQVEGVDAEKHKEEIMKASIHKIYHLWMGGYVRPHWWSDAWLSESFGIYFQYVIANQIYPEWKMEDRFITEVLQEALFEEEMYPNSIISSPTKSPSEIQTQKFNTFLNKKGASIINMLQQIIDDNLKRGFQTIVLRAHKYEFDITPNNLWDEIDQEIKKTDSSLLPNGILVKTFMQTWLLSSGYPLISVFTNEHGEVVMKEEMYHSPLTTNKIPDYDWIVPITCEKKSSTSEKHVTWLHDSKPVTTDYRLNKDEWVLCNFNQGYYRVSYSKENWNLLIEQLKSQPGNINNVGRAQLIDDSFHLAIYNKLSFSMAFNLGSYLEKESDMLPWFSFIKYITHFLRLYEETDVSDYLKRYFLDLIKHQFNRIGFEPRNDESYIMKIGRPNILSIACQLGLSDCLASSTRVYNTFTNDLTKVPAELKYVVYCNSFETLKDKQIAWDKLWAVYKNSQAMSEKELVLSSLACVNDEIFFKKYLRMTIDSEGPTLFQYEKECIIKSSVKFYKGVTAALEVLHEMVPKLRFQSEKTNQTLLLMAEEINFNIHSSEHIEKAKQIAQQLENYKNKNDELLKSMRESIDLGTRKIDYKIKNTDEIKQAVHDITGFDPPTTTTTYRPSTASTSTHNHMMTTTNPSEITTNSSQVPSSDRKVTPFRTAYLIIMITGLILNIV